MLERNGCFRKASAASFSCARLDSVRKQMVLLGGSSGVMYVGHGHLSHRGRDRKPGVAGTARRGGRRARRHGRRAVVVPGDNPRFAGRPAKKGSALSTDRRHDRHALDWTRVHLRRRHDGNGRCRLRGPRDLALLGARSLEGSICGSIRFERFSSMPGPSRRHL